MTDRKKLADDFGVALYSHDGVLDAWLEAHNESEVREAILAFKNTALASLAEAPAATGEATPLPGPAFRLTWRGERGAYYVDRPNIGDTDCYTEQELLKYGEARAVKAWLDRAELDARPAADVAAMREALQSLLAFVTESAGMTPEIVADKHAFAKFLQDCETLKESVVAQAVAALASAPAQVQPVADKWPDAKPVATVTTRVKDGVATKGVTLHESAQDLPNGTQLFTAVPLGVIEPGREGN